MNKLVKKLAVCIMTLGIAVTSLAAGSVDVEAAVKKDTYTYDKAKGVLFETAMRTAVNTRSYSTVNFYLKNEGDYVAGVKSSSKNLIAKIVHSYAYTGDSSISGGLGAENAGAGDVSFKSNYEIQTFARKEGTYTLTVTIKNAKNKKVCTKKVKVYATKYEDPFSCISYGNAKYYGTSPTINTKKSAGKFKVKMNPTYKLVKIEVGEIVNGQFTFRKAANGKTLTLNQTLAYKELEYSYESSYGKSESWAEYDGIYPLTPVRITYRDTKLKTTAETVVDIININR